MDTRAKQALLVAAIRSAGLRGDPRQVATLLGVSPLTLRGWLTAATMIPDGALPRIQGLRRAADRRPE